jgi:TonB family protein
MIPSLMAVRRSLIRSWRRFRRPTLARLVWASLALHVAVALGILAWLARESPQAPQPSRAPLIVELPPAEPGPPLVRPETPPSRGSAARPTPPAARPAPAPRPPSAAPPNVAKLPEPSPPTTPAPPAPVTPPPTAPAPPAPPVLARAPEPVPLSPAEPTPAPPVASVAPSPEPPVAPVPSIEPSTPAGAARPPEPAAGAAAPSRPAPPAPPAEPSEAPLAGRRFSLLSPKLDVPPPAGPSGRGGTQPEGTGAGESGAESEGQIAVPLNTPDPRYAAYFAEVKRRIEDKWTYPQEAARKGQTGQGDLRFILRKDGSVRAVEIVHSSGVMVFDRYIENAIRLASPFPPIPASVGDDVILISINFTYVLGGVRAFGFR